MKKPELIIMYTWDINGYYDNKVCGHMYEIIDYYFILKDHFDTKIIFPKEYNLDEVLSKYNITIEEKTLWGTNGNLWFRANDLTFDCNIAIISCVTIVNKFVTIETAL